MCGGWILLPSFTVTITESLWIRAPPKRLTCLSKCSSLQQQQTQTDQQITGDYRRDIFTFSHDPNMLNIHVSDRRVWSSCFIWSSHLYTLHFPFQKDSGCIEGGNGSRRGTPPPNPCALHTNNLQAHVRTQMPTDWKTFAHAKKRETTPMFQWNLHMQTIRSLHSTKFYKRKLSWRMCSETQW